MLNTSVWLCPLIYPSLVVSGGLSLLCRGSLPPMEGGLVPGVQTALVVVTEGPGAGVSPEGVNPRACLGCPAAGCFASGCGKSFYALAGFQGQRLEDDSRSPAASHHRGAANLLCWRAQGDGSLKMQTRLEGPRGASRGLSPGLWGAASLQLPSLSSAGHEVLQTQRHQMRLRAAPCWGPSPGVSGGQRHGGGWRGGQGQATPCHEAGGHAPAPGTWEAG